MDNPFEILGVPQTFDQDDQALHRRFLELSAAHHPDRHPDPLDQARAVEQASLINHAYRIVKDPESRANALLDVLGGSSKEQDRSLPPELLMEMMQKREELEQAQDQDDAQAVNELLAWAESGREQHFEKIAALFRQATQTTDSETGPSTEKRDALLQEIRLELNTLRYIQRMAAQAGG